jgi:hypothetical protein
VVPPTFSGPKVFVFPGILRVETLSFEQAADFNPQSAHPVNDLGAGLVRPLTGASGAGYLGRNRGTVPFSFHRSSSEVVFAVKSARGLPAADPLLCHLPAATRPLPRYYRWGLAVARTYPAARCKHTTERAGDEPRSCGDYDCRM